MRIYILFDYIRKDKQSIEDQTILFSHNLIGSTAGQQLIYRISIGQCCCYWRFEISEVANRAIFISSSILFRNKSSKDVAYLRKKSSICTNCTIYTWKRYGVGGLHKKGWWREREREREREAKSIQSNGFKLE